jgi:hypothetical protein
LSHPLCECELLSVESGFHEHRGEPAVCAVRPAHVVVDSPVIEKYPGLEDGLEELAVTERGFGMG